MRKTKDVKITDGGIEKTFRIIQMPATQSERFTIKLLMLLSSAGNTDFSDNTAVFRAFSMCDYDKVQELFDELLSCVSVITDGIETKLNNSNADGFIEERNTLMKLKIEAFSINDFFQMSGLGEFANSPKVAILKR